ncbi:hypothetical protein FWK35_00012569 [Aphis craccivora]|uniref:Uncharacterized protein n=1 Tax=Aphis craccivora TaxID=307492 RepID=A0A6G0YWS7_APHCR|nr:hypothetical protein FWK35_00012569 [Aphis craccivora]
MMCVFFFCLCTA